MEIVGRNMNHFIESVGVLIYKGREEVLLVKHGDSASHLTGAYGLPAGRVEEGETHIDAAIRELEEETGLQTKRNDLEQLPRVYQATIERKEGSKTFNFRVYICHSHSGELRETDETIPSWVSIQDLENYSLLPNISQIVIEGLAQL